MKNNILTTSSYSLTHTRYLSVHFMCLEYLVGQLEIVFYTEGKGEKGLNASWKEKKKILKEWKSTETSQHYGTDVMRSFYREKCYENF